MHTRAVALTLGAVALLPSLVHAQTEALPAIAREAFRPRPERVAETIAPAPVRVTEEPIVRERVVAGAPVTWFDAFARNRYGYYDDAYLDDNWYYDYYELPRAAAVVADRAVGAVPGYRTSWIYEPLAERGLFSW